MNIHIDKNNKNKKLYNQNPKIPTFQKEKRARKVRLIWKRRKQREQAPLDRLS